MMRAVVPNEAPDWPQALRDARLRWWYAAQAAIEATHPSAMPVLLGRLHTAKEAFGRECLALDRRRRAGRR